MIARRENHHRALEQGTDSVSLDAIRHLRRAECDIDNAIADHVGKGVAMGLAHIEPHAGIVAGEIRDRLRKGVKAECRRASDPQLRFIPATQIVGHRADPAFGKDNRAGLGKNPFTKCCRHNALARPDHQFKSEPSLHQLHVAGQCRLRQPQRDRRAGEGTGADDFVKLEKVSWVNSAHAGSYQKLMRAGKRITHLY